MYSEKKEFTYEVEKIKKEIGLTIEQEPSSSQHPHIRYQLPVVR